MIPGNSFTQTPVPAAFIPPYDRAYTSLRQVVLGGNAIGDPTAGRQVKNWVVMYAGGLIQVAPEGDATVFSLSATDVKTVSLAFDNNMGVVLTWMTTGGANLYYYDTTLAAYTTRFFSGVTSSRVCVDDYREFNTAASDVIFGYTLNGSVYWRQQRDRYDIERSMGVSAKKLRKMAPSVLNRLQFELR